MAHLCAYKISQYFIHLMDSIRSVMAHPYTRPPLFLEPLYTCTADTGQELQLMLISA